MRVVQSSIASEDNLNRSQCERHHILTIDYRSLLDRPELKMASPPVSAAFLPSEDAQRKAPARARVGGSQQPDIRKADRPKSVSPTLEHPLHEPSIDACVPSAAKIRCEYDFPPSPLPETE